MGAGRAPRAGWSQTRRGKHAPEHATGQTKKIFKKPFETKGWRELRKRRDALGEKKDRRRFLRAHLKPKGRASL